MIEVVQVSRRDFLHGLAQCPSCHLHLDSQKDVDELLQPVEEARSIGARMTHRRCGASFEVRLLEPRAVRTLERLLAEHDCELTDMGST